MRGLDFGPEQQVPPADTQSNWRPDLGWTEHEDR
jgi:hypothetical protein